MARRLILRCHELAHKAAADDRDTQKLISELGTVADELGEQLSLTHEIPDMPTATAEAMARVREIRKRVARGGTAGWGDWTGLWEGCGQARSTCSPPARAWERRPSPFSWR